MPAIKPVVALEHQQEQKLRAMLSKGTWPARTLRRARILLTANDQPDLSNTQIGQLLGCHRETTRGVKKRYFQGGLDAALFDSPRPGNGGKLTDKDKAFIIATACSEPPNGADHWTLELLTRQLKWRHKKVISGETIRLLLHANQLKPWQKKNVVYSQGNGRI